MKKVYAMGMVLAASMTAMAATPVVNNKNVSEEMLQRCSDVVLTEGVRTYTETAGPAKAIENVEDLYGLRTWSYVGALQGQSGPAEAVVNIEAGRNSAYINVTGFPHNSLTTEIKVNLADKTVELSKQVCGGTINTTSGPATVSLYLYKRGDDKKLTSYSGPLKGTIGDDGSITFESDVYVGVTDDEDAGWYRLAYDNAFKAMKWNTPDLSEYDKIGNGTYKDGYFAALYAESEDEVDYLSFTPYEVEIYKNKTNPNLLVVKDPYVTTATINVDGTSQTGNPWELTGLADDFEAGYLLLNVADKEAIAVMPLVPCGIKMNMGSADAPAISSFYLYNFEGYVLNNGGTEALEDYKEEAEANFQDLSRVDEEDENTIIIENEVFGYGSDVTGNKVWKLGMLPTIITLPEGWDDNSGVKNVAVDSDASVRYYNLQGMEVSAPVKGQLTIKKQGNKAVKFIAK